MFNYHPDWLTSSQELNLWSTWLNNKFWNKSSYFLYIGTVSSVFELRKNKCLQFLVVRLSFWLSILRMVKIYVHIKVSFSYRFMHQYFWLSSDFFGCLGRTNNQNFACWVQWRSQGVGWVGGTPTQGKFWGNFQRQRKK